MCGVFGIIGPAASDADKLQVLVKHSEQRGRDSSGLISINLDRYAVVRADYPITDLVRGERLQGTTVIIGHSRLITNGARDNQPVIRDGVAVIHNGIIVNDEDVWRKSGYARRQIIDSEIIAAYFSENVAAGETLSVCVRKLLDDCVGVMACAVLVPSLGKLCLFSNNGSLYLGELDGSLFFASESYALNLLGCMNIEQIQEPRFIDVPVSNADFEIRDVRRTRLNLIPSLGAGVAGEEKHLTHFRHNLRRCSKCVLPETMPFIAFDASGICNYCRTYKVRNEPKPKAELFGLVERYRRSKGLECIVPFSGGRDSCYALHLIVKELKMRPLTYTYDWGMVTDLGRRNISRMCGELGVENIIVAADIAKKREYIKLNLQAWLKSPHLGLISVLTAGDKHFFRHVETVKAQTGIKLNLWGVNPLEVTHFKAGFLGVPPDFEEKRVYAHGIMKQLRYQALRLRAMLSSPGYFNKSLWDTISGEYYRSFTDKQDYFHIFDYWEWDEEIVDSVLELYDWERAVDTTTTWRIGDGTAAFYNYVYYSVAGFTEHDTFRSNQIREGVMRRDRALQLVEEENRPRYQNIKWYLDAVGLDFVNVIRVINGIQKMYTPTELSPV